MAAIDTDQMVVRVTIVGGSMRFATVMRLQIDIERIYNQGIAVHRQGDVNEPA